MAGFYMLSIRRQQRGKSLEKWSVQVTALNGNSRFLLDNNTFGGTNWVNPREISVQVRYRFRY